jgi:protein tyrosine/serine phosphatase
MIKRICSGFPFTKTVKLVAVIGIFALVLLNIANGAETSPTNRPARWAIPMQMEGVPNLHKVSDTLYRSAQPSAAGMKNLKAMGIETVINLRSFHSDRDEIGDTGLAYEHIHMKAWHAEEEDAVKFLQIVTNPKRRPVLVHCQHGADRTGTMCALSRVAVGGWTKEEALEEMTQGGFGFHGIWDNLIQWINGLDIDRIKKKAGIN